MLSILIPVYNYDIRSLVADLHQQGLESRIKFEIICMDDNSVDTFKTSNKAIETHLHVDYQLLKKNIGRSQIRNRLAEAAKYEYLLFMDCDSKVVSNQYLKGYIEQLSPNTLLYGGRCYQAEAPDQNTLLLHWIYGSQREVQSAAKRKENPYHAFMTNNFLVPKTVFNQIRFDENLTQYGHEDTLFGLELKKRSIPILHFENPLEHTGLETADHFLDKTNKGIENLANLAQQHADIDTRLLVYYKKLKKNKVHYFLPLAEFLLSPFIRKNLRSSRPSLTLFDIYKLFQIHQVYNRL